jgi:putative membrane-bound dehydrogenase-like protein
MKKIVLFLTLMLSFSSIFAQTGRRLEILFLGDNGHHKPIERVPTIMAALGNKGINFTYTDKLEDINAQNLSKYDALMIFANWDDITPAAEKALLDYVASGKGILPIHCASYCFRNSPEYVKMVGGQFWRHRMDTIQVNTVQPNHIIMKDLGVIKAFDETYLHSQLQPDNNVLQTREIKADQTKDRPDAKTEPYTWTRSYGKGRVFYTAYGHDDRTWSNVNFQKLLENGIVWAVNDEARAAHAALNLKPLEYKGAKLPNYEKRPGEQLQQLALTPEESMKHIQVPADFDLSLFAAEPNVMHPIAMSWDEKGRLYVLITKDYPNERKESGGSDYILICEDTNKDGKADKFTRFAEGLSIPTGMVFANGGLLISQAPHMLFLKDTDGDDKADEKKVLFTGFGTGDTHAGPSNLHYGFDNWIWGCVGYSGFSGKLAEGDSLKFGQAFFRFKPDGSKMEWTTSTSNNTWGMGFNEAGDIFGSTANNSHGWYMAIPHQNFLNPGFNGDNGSRGTDTHKDMKPITEKVRQVDVFGGFTAASGHNFYTARAFPKNYWNQIAFVSEPTGHILHQNRMVKKGTNYEDKESFNLMASADEWFSPVFSEVGPDGAVWVADWYSYIIQHNPRPDGFKMGVGNAYETDLRDFTHGRIYRVGYKNAPAYQPITLNKNDKDGLLKALKNDNMFWRTHAQRLLVERGNTDVVPALITFVNDQSVDELGLNPAAIHSLWALKGLGAIDKNPAALQAAVGALKHQSWAVRKNAVQVLPTNAKSVDVILKNNLLNDKEPLVILNSVLALNQMPFTASAEKAILTRIDQATEATDRWLPDAFATALTSHKSVLLKKHLRNLTMSKTAAASHDHSMMKHGATMTETKVATTAAETASPGVDLVITNMRTEPTSPFVREGMRYFVEVKNNGTDSLKKGQIASLKIEIMGVGQKSTVWSKVHSTGIAPNETVTISKNTNGPWSGDFGFSTDLAGEYTFTLMVDEENKIAEGNERNNTFVKKVTYQQSQKLSTFALERAARSYASVSAPDSIVTLLKLWDKLPNTENAALLKGLSSGWNPRKKGTVNAANQEFMVSLSNKLSDDNLTRINKLMQAWNLKNSASEAEKDAIIINIKTVVEAMKFDRKEFSVPAGKTIILVLENPDAMQHNLVIGKPKSLEIIGNAANKMITQKDAVEKNYVPAIPQILFSTPLVNAGETYRLKFTAPAQVGDYPFVCTFPGHWSIMNGVMKVVN